jgi:hypothetical protein
MYLPLDIYIILYINTINYNPNPYILLTKEISKEDYVQICPQKMLAHGRWFSPGTPASSTTKTGRQHVSIMTFISQKIRESDFWSKGTKGPYQESQYRITPSVIYIMLLVSSICINRSN